MVETMETLHNLLSHNPKCFTCRYYVAKCRLRNLNCAMSAPYAVLCEFGSCRAVCLHVIQSTKGTDKLGRTRALVAACFFGHWPSRWERFRTQSPMCHFPQLLLSHHLSSQWRIFFHGHTTKVVGPNECRFWWL